MALYSHIALHRFNLLPSQFLALDQKERAFIIASIDIELEKEQDAVK